MKTFLTAAALLALTSGAQLVTDYGQKRGLRIESQTTFYMETTSMSRNGESVDLGDNSNETVHEVAEVIEFRENADGHPTLVRHRFEDVGGSATMEFGDRSNERDLESPFADSVVELRKTDDGVEAEVVEGSPPEDDLEALGMTCALDALLPGEEVDVDASWDLDADAIKRALGFDVRNMLFPRPERPEGQPGEGRRGGGRGMRGGGFGGGGLGQLDQADWEGKATLVSLDVDHDGTSCAEVKLELECTVDLPDPEFGGGGGRRGRAVEPPFGAPAVDGEMQAELEGRLLWSIKEKRPVYLELSGDVTSRRTIERSRGENTFTMSTEQEGSLSIKIEVTQQEIE